MRCIRISFWLTISGALVLGGGVAYGAQFTPLGGLPTEPFSSAASGISGDGATIVGSSGFFGKAVEWQGGEISTLGPGDARDVSDYGSVVVGNTNGGRPVKWTSSGPSELGTLPGGPIHGVAYGVWANGSVIVGFT